MRCAIPVYTYQCEECGLRFTKRRKASQARLSLPCLSCKSEVELSAPKTLNSQFKVKGDGGMGPQNTGVSSYDANVDRVIGDHAQTSWKSIDQRLSHKRKIIQNSDVSGFDLSRQKDGDYRIMTAQERQAAETARNLHTKAMNLFKKRDEREKKGSENQ